MKLIGFHPDAEAEVTEPAQYHEVRKSGLGADLLVEVERALDRILTNPRLPGESEGERGGRRRPFNWRKRLKDTAEREGPTRP